MEIRLHLQDNGHGPHSLRLSTHDRQLYRVLDTDLPAEQVAVGDYVFHSAAEIGSTLMITTENGDLRAFDRRVVRIDLIAL
jgi:hypothetical protein